MQDKNLHTSREAALYCLQKLVAIPALSRNEAARADYITSFLENKNVTVRRVGQNIWAVSKNFKNGLPALLLNSHLDTVAPNKGYTLNPYDAKIRDGKIYGLGTTDAGASLVCLLLCFLYFSDVENLPFNIIFAASAEEEISGSGGISLLFRDEDFRNAVMHDRSVAIVGEPTQLDLAIAEKGLLVLDVEVTGQAGHAAREEGENAIYKAIEIADWFRTYKFSRISALLGEMKMTVTGFYTANTAHNVVPALCTLMVDVRVTDAYTHEEVLEEITHHIKASVRPRSTRLRSTCILDTHPLVAAGVHLGKRIYGSPTSSDKALMPIPALKCGPGFSGQSHSADEFILLEDIYSGVNFYINLVSEFAHSCKQNNS
ncbi:MAG: M20/M25/M40 family metallo-hydrolase [Ferruginibacter sp.]